MTRIWTCHYSLGFYVEDEGATIGDIVPRSPADLAGASPGSHLIAINGLQMVPRNSCHDTPCPRRPIRRCQDRAAGAEKTICTRRWN